MSLGDTWTQPQFPCLIVKQGRKQDGGCVRLSMYVVGVPVHTCEHSKSCIHLDTVYLCVFLYEYEHVKKGVSEVPVLLRYSFLEN